MSSASGPPASDHTADFTATLPRKRMASAVLFRDDGGRILLVEPVYKDDWELPGGSVEADESPYEAARREVEEELGLAVTPGRLLVVDWVPPRANRTEGVMLVYDGGVLDSARSGVIRLQAEELRGWAWSTLAEARRLLSPLLARRAAAAIEAVSDRSTAYLENGTRVA